jgi:hypothetical protein
MGDSKILTFFPANKIAFVTICQLAALSPNGMGSWKLSRYLSWYPIFFGLGKMKKKKRVATPKA